eukprot:c3754_g1_i1.p1 GENE.c3754_g1_i1~~c3754_g1_i1.p1  ORF type:complete len:285 (-),score=35.07 c3754_g1_i1:78-887(-)
MTDKLAARDPSTPSEMEMGDNRVPCEANLCIVCLEKPHDACLPCSHSVMCQTCATNVMLTSGQCPTCRCHFEKLFVGKCFVTAENFVKDLGDSDCRTVTLTEAKSRRPNTGRPAATSVPIPPPQVQRSRLAVHFASSSSAPSRATAAILVISLIFICQGFIFMKCKRENICHCTPHQFADNSTCITMCACESHGCLDSPHLPESWEATCRLNATWQAHESSICWRRDGGIQCKNNLSSVVSLVGSILMILVVLKKLLFFFCRPWLSPSR